MHRFTQAPKQPKSPGENLREYRQRQRDAQILTLILCAFLLAFGYVASKTVVRAVAEFYQTTK